MQQYDRDLGFDGLILNTGFFGGCACGRGCGIFFTGPFLFTPGAETIVSKHNSNIRYEPISVGLWWNPGAAALCSYLTSLVR